MGYTSREVVQLLVFMNTAGWRFNPPRGLALVPAFQTNPAPWWLLGSVFITVSHLAERSGCFLSALLLWPSLASQQHPILRGSFAQRGIYKSFWWRKERKSWENQSQKDGEYIPKCLWMVPGSCSRTSRVLLQEGGNSPLQSVCVSLQQEGKYP